MPPTLSRMTNMKVVVPVCASAAAMWVATVARAADTYLIDPARSTVGFAVSSLVVNTVRGKFAEFAGTVTVEDNQVTEAKINIETRSMNTGVGRRDKDLRSASFFDVERYPTITFHSKGTHQKGSDQVLVGDFTMHGVTKEVSLPVKFKGPISNLRENGRISLEAKTRIKRKGYGLIFNKFLDTGGLVVGDEVVINIKAEAVKSQPNQAESTKVQPNVSQLPTLARLNTLAPRS